MYNFIGTSISKDERKKVEKLATEAFDSFENDLKGKYYSLESMTEE